MDDLLALMEDGGEGAIASSGDVALAPPSSSPTQNRIVTPASSERPVTSTKNKKKSKKNASQTVDTQVDHRLGIRMTQRNMGSLDMLDHIASSNYHSPAALAAMSLDGLNQQVLLEPTPVLDVATVCGRTNLLTIGIVFSNTGTKIASSGKGFCCLTIGSNLQSGPSVSVLLFGPAYSKYCSSAKPGLVVAVTDPRLIPPKPNDYNKKSSLYDTSISFSISDENQFTIIAKARDYGVCQAMVKGKNAQGHWVNNAKRCSTAVDTRVSKFCQLHRKQENVRTNGANSNSSNKGTFMQQQRQEHNLQSVRREGTNGRGGVLILPNNKGSQNSILNATPAPNQGGASSRLKGVPKQMVKGAPSQTQQPLAQRPDIITRQVPSASRRLSNNGILNPKCTQVQSNHAQQVDLMSSVNNRSANSSTNGLLNPYLRKAESPFVTKVTMNPYGSKPKSATAKEQGARPVLHNSTNRQQKKRSMPVVHDWLASATSKKHKNSDGTASKKASSTRSRRGLNTIAMGGFDGQVPVPKPCKIFASTVARPQRTANSRTEDQKQRSMEDILSKQQRLAQAARVSKNDASTRAATKSAKKQAEKSSRSSFFDSIPDPNDFDRETLVNAKSRFATEADAEAYALSRRRVTELEEEEARKETSKKKKEKEQQDNIIGKEWVCQTCNNKRSRFEPKVCIRSNHKVKCKRILNKAVETKEDMRVKLSNAAVEDGGIMLGSGLEWSRFPSNRFS